MLTVSRMNPSDVARVGMLRSVFGQLMKKPRDSIFATMARARASSASGPMLALKSSTYHSRAVQSPLRRSMSAATAANLQNVKAATLRPKGKTQ